MYPNYSVVYSRDKDELYERLFEYGYYLYKVALYESFVKIKNELGVFNFVALIPNRVVEVANIPVRKNFSNVLKSGGTLDNLKVNESIVAFPWQEKAIREILDKKHRKGLVKAPTGSGKTIFALLLAKTLNSPTIVVVDREVLIDQWISSVNKVFKNPNIIELNANTVEKINLNCYDFAITTVQFLNSLMKKNFSQYESLFRNSCFNMVVYDEAHTTSAAIMFGKSVALFRNFAYIFGVTATPYISGFPLHFYTIGEVIVNAEKLGYKNFLKDQLTIKVAREKFNVRFKMWDGIERNHLLANYHTALEGNKAFVDYVEKLVRKKLSEGRKILLVFSRLSTVNLFSKLFPDAKILTSKRKDALDEKTTNLIIATYGVSSKGFDFPPIDTLITSVLIYGKVSSVQLIGRILRYYPNKKPPEAIFVVDKHIEDLLAVDVESEIKQKVKMKGDI